MWSNYSNYQVDLGTIAAYEISPVMMDLFGLEQPLYFQYLNRQLRYGYRSCTGGVTVNWDGTVGRGLTGAPDRLAAGPLAAAVRPDVRQGVRPGPDGPSAGKNRVKSPANTKIGLATGPAVWYHITGVSGQTGRPPERITHASLCPYVPPAGGGGQSASPCTMRGGRITVCGG